MSPGWRTRLHVLSHDRAWLKRTSLVLVAWGFVAALVLAALTQGREEGVAPDPVERVLREEWQALRRAETPQPRSLAAWLRRVAGSLEHLSRVTGRPVPDWRSFKREGGLFEFETVPLLERHAPDPTLRRVLEAFLQAWLELPSTDGREALERLEALARSDVELANEMLAALRLRDRDQAGALALLLREGQLFEAATPAREAALRLALRLRDGSALRAMAQTAGWLEAMPPLLQHHAGTLLRDFGLQWRGLLGHRLDHLPLGALALAGFAALLWWVVLVLQGPAVDWRWLWPLGPLLAGVLSVWPAVSVGAWQEVVHGMSADAPFPHDLWYYVGGVGLREELAKLAAGALFLPGLLRRRVPGRALFTGAFVGLGFAFEENLNYYEQYGGGVAVVRFLTANFMHAALSGLILHALEQALRTRFARVEGFLLTLPAAVAVHGAYDFGASSDLSGLDFLAMMLLALTAWHFLDLAEAEARPGRRWVCPGAVVVLGTALLLAWCCISTALRTPDLASLAGAAMDGLAVLPLVFIYWHRLGPDLP